MKKPGSFILLAAIIGVILIAARAPLYHNPDANYYYGTSLVLSEGRFFDSIEGKQSPLLSWLMAPLVAFGVPIVSAFRVVNCAAFVALLLALHSISLKLPLTPLEVRLSLFLVALHTIYLTVSVITSDLLAASIYLWLLSLFLLALENKVRFRWVGVMAGGAYYAKAIFLPLTLFVITQTCAVLSFITKRILIKEWAVITSFVIIAALPWCIMLSITYETPIFSGQQLIITHPIGRFFYSPRNREAITQPEPFSLTERRYGPSIPNTRLASISRAAPYLYTTTRDLLFGPDALKFYIAVVILHLASAVWRSNRSFLVVTSFAWGYFIPHFIIWGAYLRYFLPVLPLFHLIAVHSYCSVIAGIRSRVIRGGVTAIGVIVVFSMTKTTASAILGDWSDREAMQLSTWVEIVARELGEGRGVVTGNTVSEIPPLAAFQVKREFWGYLDPSLGDTPEEVKEKLMKWEVTSIIWVGPRWPLLDLLDGVNWRRTVFLNGEEIHLYSVD